jgi:hypothetical protein
LLFSNVCYDLVNAEPPPTNAPSGTTALARVFTKS